MFSIDYGSRGITGLRQQGSEIEFIENGAEFGGFGGKISAEAVFDFDFRADEAEREIQNGYECFWFEKHNIRFAFSVKQENGRLSFCYEITNKTNNSADILDLFIPFPMNTRCKWGDDASKKVIRHSFISQENSYMFWTRCNNEPDYLLFLPQMSMEYFDVEYTSKEKSSYRAYIHAKAAEQIAREKGCNWRQKVSSKVIAAGETASYTFTLEFAKSYDDIRERLVKNGFADVTVLPGMSVPSNLEAKVRIHSKSPVTVAAEYPADTEIVENEGIFTIKFNRLGENLLNVEHGGKRFILEFFVTEPLETLIDKRADFIRKRQIRDEKLWYNGLLAEWNMETGALLSPDNYDKIKGWRIYEVTCDDPGLSKPSFLSSKNAIRPVQREVEALDYYLENFVWGGLQNTDDNEYPYAIYGIPDWHKNRNSEDEGIRGKMHIWRVYDYPHIFLTYFSMYRIAKNFTGIETKLSKEEYLERAYRTAIALFTIPSEVIDWSALSTGFYNERVIEEMIDELYSMGWKIKANRLKNWWERKVFTFVMKKADVFGSEYPFDTTGFESTYALARYASEKNMTRMKEDDRLAFPAQTERFIHSQASCNIACRGYLEPAYYHLGSDYRGDSSRYTLSYMAQMGGGALLHYALCYADSPFEILRLGYASLLSSWAIMNTGTKETNYGYWFPGEEHDGGCGGGFEPAPYGETWLEQPHHRGSWYYSCEMDLGYTGYLRDSVTVLVKDPIFGDICLGGTMRTDGGYEITLSDGVYKKFYAVGEKTVMLEMIDGTFETNNIRVSKDLTSFHLSVRKSEVDSLINIMGFEGTFTLEYAGNKENHSLTKRTSGTRIVLPAGTTEINLELTN